ncbi:hypothetical protein H4I95_09823 [Botrytis cinerea]
MGNCSSCLGLERNRDSSDEGEDQRLLFENDAHSHHYGSFGNQDSNAIQADPQEVQRETEALQKVVAQTSNHLVDIFAMVPQNVPRAPVTMYNGRIEQYKTNPVEGTHPISDGWASDDEDVEEMKKYKPVKSEDVGPLLGGFADAESTME